MDNRRISIIASDAGGTMTDIIALDTQGNFFVGKASTTPEDQSIGFWESMGDALGFWGADWDKKASEILKTTDTVIYAGTVMLNALLTRGGTKIGLIVNKGFEDVLLQERGAHIFAGYSYPDRLHKVSHIHNVPLVPKSLIRGVTERTDMFGEVAIPLYEHEVRQAVEQLLERKADAIAICFLYSYLNNSDEKKTAEIAQQVLTKKGLSIPVYTSSEFCPITREVSRLFSLLLQASGAEPAKKHLFNIEKKLQNNGYKYPLQILLASGGIANIRFKRLHEATFSGPIGGILGAKYLAETVGTSNWVCSDMGGTSFDVGIIRGREPIILREVEMAHMMFNIPTLVMDSIGAGTGQYLTIDPIRRRIEIGPESAGAKPGPVCYEMGNQVPTVMDCCLILGILNPDYYLGGRMKLNKDLAYKAIKEKCSDALGLDPYEFAEGVIDLINSRMKEHIRSVLYSRGFSPADYYLLSYGGAGPMFMAGYSDGMPFKGVATVPFAAAFSSFGCAVADFAHRYQKSVLITTPYGADPETKMRVGNMLNSGWEEMEQLAIQEMEAEGIPRKEIKLQQIAYVRYGGQIEDLEVFSPVRRINSPEDVDKLMSTFEDDYTKAYTGVARHSEGGYQIMELGLLSSTPKAKAKLAKFPLGPKTPPAKSIKGERRVYLSKRWQTARLYEIDALVPGNEIAGLAIIEAPATTLVVPPGKKIRIDEWKIFWLGGEQE